MQKLSLQDSLASNELQEWHTFCAFPFRRRKGSSVRSLGAETVITDQLIKVSDVEGVMSFSLLAFLSSIWTGWPLIKTAMAVV